MLNIGLLAPGAGEYYIGEVASSAEDYYTGHGESAGRWVGSLAFEMGLRGEVDPDDFRAVLTGRDPFSGEQLIHRKAVRNGEKPAVGADQYFDVLQAASILGVSGRYVRRLLEDGDRYAQQLISDEGADVAVPKKYLLGERTRGTNEPADAAAMGPVPWQVSGAELTRFMDSRHEKKYRPGYDLTLRPPKSVSVLWALGGPEIAGAVREAHTAAVDEVVRYYEHHAVRAREPKTGRRVETDGMIAAAFDHRTSRAGDPLLHTHVVTANMTRFDTDEGTEWRSVESSNLFEHAKAAGCLYQAHLRHELSHRLGVRFLPAANGYAEIDGVAERVIEMFSKRRNEIEEELAATGRTSARSAQVATLETRKAKDYSVDADTLMSRWRAEAASVGFDSASARACTGVATPTSLTSDDAERILELLAGPHGLCERASTFRRSDVIETIATLVGSAATAGQIEELANRFLVSDRVVAVASTEMVRVDRRRLGQQRWTTVELATLENRLVGRSNRMVSPDHTIRSEVLADVVATRPELSDEQTTMVEAVCTSARFVLPVEGRPGAGKTYAVEAIVAAHVDSGVPVVGCAVSAAAASELEAQAGFKRSASAATTVAKLLHDLDRFDGLAAGTTIIVDEASMIGTRALARLADHAERANGRMVLVGDPDQHGSVDAGGVFAHLCGLQGDELVKLVENRRQDDHIDRLAIDDYRNGLIADAVQRLDDADRVVRSRTAGESFDAMVADWYAARLSGSADPMIAGPNSTRRALNERARVLLKASGELTGKPLHVAGREFQVGDSVVARRNDRKLHATGSKDFVKNGSVGVIEEIHHHEREITVRFEREGTIRVPNVYLAAGRIEHGYARTTYGVQGHTHGVARYHPTDASGFEEGYVAVTRGRQGARLYVVDGTISVDQDEHHSHETVRHSLDDITDAFGRRRANTMAADLNPSLDHVADLVRNHSLSELHRRRRQLDRQLAATPPNPTHVIEESTRARDALTARLRAIEETADGVAPPGLLRRIDHLDKRIAAATQHLHDREQWIAGHAELFEEHRVIGDAERAAEAQIRQHPFAHLPSHVVAALGPEPELQRHRSTWMAAASATAIHRHRYDVPQSAGLDVEGPAALLGERPADPLAALSWDYAAGKLALVELEPALESGAEL